MCTFLQDKKFPFKVIQKVRATVGLSDAIPLHLPGVSQKRGFIESVSLEDEWHPHRAGVSFSHYPCLWYSQYKRIVVIPFRDNNEDGQLFFSLSLVRRRLPVWGSRPHVKCMKAPRRASLPCMTKWRSPVQMCVQEQWHRFIMGMCDARTLGDNEMQPPECGWQMQIFGDVELTKRISCLHTRQHFWHWTLLPSHWKKNQGLQLFSQGTSERSSSWLAMPNR